MKFKYRIRVFDYPQTRQGVSNVIKQYQPERQEDTFI